MMRVIHFFDLNPGVDKRQVFKEFEIVEEYLKSNGCIERRTMRLLDASSKGGEPIASAEYINENLWSGKEAAETAFQEMPPDVRQHVKEFLSKIAMEKSVRYVDDGVL